MKGAFVMRLAAIAIALFALDLFAADKPTLRIATTPYPLQAPLWAAKELGYLDEELSKVGATYTWNVFENGPLINEAARAGDIDTAILGDQPALIAKSVGLDIVAIANIAAGEKAMALVAPTDSPIKRFEDIRGKKIAYGKGTYVQHLLVLLLEKHGVKSDEFEHINLGANDIPIALENRQIDGAVIWEHYISLLTLSGKARVIADGTGIKQGNIIAYARNDYAKKHPQVLAAYIRALDRGARYVSDHPNEAAAALAPAYKLPLDVTTASLKRIDFRIKFTPRDLAEIADAANYLLKEKIIRKKVDTAAFISVKYIDLAGI
ncbi:MAG: aliphatic sulfonate ABC transporter substrate-binding protein [Helicobacteraceae bacterium]|jgi:sulfonate transport system substrate-binding protein|nr:aliphatic sulfonate ABC transporter substrate-binding protein [Helicobacteraceae bacterium]